MRNKPKGDETMRERAFEVNLDTALRAYLVNHGLDFEGPMEEKYDWVFSDPELSLSFANDLMRMIEAMYKEISTSHVSLGNARTLVLKHLENGADDQDD